MNLLRYTIGVKHNGKDRIVVIDRLTFDYVWQGIPSNDPLTLEAQKRAAAAWMHDNMPGWESERLDNVN